MKHELLEQILIKQLVFSRCPWHCSVPKNAFCLWWNAILGLEITFGFGKWKLYFTKSYVSQEGLWIFDDAKLNIWARHIKKRLTFAFAVVIATVKSSLPKQTAVPAASQSLNWVLGEHRCRSWHLQLSCQCEIIYLCGTRPAVSCCSPAGQAVCLHVIDRGPQGPHLPACRSPGTGFVWQLCLRRLKRHRELLIVIDSDSWERVREMQLSSQSVTHNLYYLLFLL